MRFRCGRSLAADLSFIPLQRAAGRTLRRPAQLPQDAPSLHGGELHPAFALDQVRHTPGGPQAAFVSQRFRAALQSPHDAFQLGRAQARLAPGTLERRSPAMLQLFGPAAHRLPVHAHSPSHLGLRHSLAQQTCAQQTPPFQFLELFGIPPYSSWVSHAPNIPQESRNVTILCNIQ